MNQVKGKRRNPWLWIPTLYFAEGLPYVAVMTISVVMYSTLGLSNTDVAFYTSWLYLPWVIKPFWSPFVDIIKTKRWWILVMQLLLGAALGGVAFTIPGEWWLQGSLFFFWLMAFSSATHDIAADGFYMLGLDSHQQSFFVGIRSTFYRLATILGQGFACLTGWRLRGHDGQSAVFMVVTLLSNGGYLHCLVALSPVGSASTCRGQRHGQNHFPPALRRALGHY